MALIETVGVAIKPSSRAAVEVCTELEALLQARGVAMVLDRESALALGRSGGPPRTDLASEVDLVVVLGGDGTLLSVTRGAVDSTPVLGVNLGTLGFLTEHAPDEWAEAVEATLDGRAEIERRERLTVTWSRGEETVTSAVLNDAVVNKSALARIVPLVVRVDGELLTRFRADGLIVSTPTGATGYNLSAGGPILAPTLGMMVITPICPHALTHRPLCVSLDSEVEIELGESAEEVYLTLDGQEDFPMQVGDRVGIRRCHQPVWLVKSLHRSFFQILHHKLKWGDRDT